MATKRKIKDDVLFRKNKILAYERSGGMCELCRCRPAQEVHHIVYRSHLGTSILSNLACLCLQCHNDAHGVNAKKIRKHLLEMVSVE